MTFYKEVDIVRIDRAMDPEYQEKCTVDCQKAIEEGEPILVEQSHREAVDINNIIKKHAGNLELIAKNAELIEFNMDDIPTNDFMEMQNIMIKAKQAFESVPSDIRKQFDHNPAQYMDFIRNPENKEKLIEMGLANAPEVVDNSPIEVVIAQTTPEPPVT